MAPRVYTSTLPEVPILTTSIFTRLFASRGPGDVGGFPGSVTAFIDAASGASITRTQLKHLALSFAHGLRDHPATGPFAKRGATVLIYSPNSLAWPVVLHGGVAGGLRCALANSAYNARELAYQYTDSTAKLVLTAEEGLPVVRAMFAELGLSKAEGDRRIVVLGNDLRWAGGPAAAPAPDAAGLLTLADLLVRGTLDREEMFEGQDAHETVFLCYSSGTTGKPKGVETTHQNMTTVVDICENTGPPMEKGVDRMIAILPFYHIFGVSNILTFGIAVACPTVIMTRFEPVQFCANIAKYKIVFGFIVPPILVVLARHPAVDSYDLSSLQYMLSGAAPLGPELVRMVQKRLLSKRKPGSQCIITQGYGLTETSPSTHMLMWDIADRNVGSVGELLPTLLARLVDDDDGKVDAREGKPGELWIKGKTVMKGYLNNVAATKNAITPDGWFRTGDVAIRDNKGQFYIVDRRKELIKYKGFQVPPAELEALLLTHPDVADAAVIGVDSVAEATELPRAYVVPARADLVKTPKAKAAFEQAIITWVAGKVANHKRLRGGVKVIDVVPKSAAGKILRRELRDLAKEEAARGEIDVDGKSKKGKAKL
ncbi:AMP binding protein [Mycena belliarum]|uniref:AMP binding protein n=1 Tax=Mycena belliarum TaxID=1033014 RepID=A0AAD6XXL6_9AGAR|nr:AMP binding protein [Mycena belliae]